MCKDFMSRLTPYLKEHAPQNNLRHNPDLEYDADLIQFTWDSPKESTYAVHNDINMQICNTGLSDIEYLAEQVVVATLIIGNDWPPGIEVFLVFQDKDGKEMTRLRIPKDAWHVQLHNMQLIFHFVKVVVMGDVDVDLLFRGVLSMHLTGHFQRDALHLEKHLSEFGFPSLQNRSYVNINPNYSITGVVNNWPHYVNLNLSKSNDQCSALPTSPLPLVAARSLPSRSLTDVSQQIRLKSDHYKRHSSMHWGSNIPHKFAFNYTISLSGSMWEHLLSSPYMSVLVEQGFFINVAHHKDNVTHRAANVSIADNCNVQYDYIHFGPAVHEEVDGQWQEIPPGTLVTSTTLSKNFRLSSSTRHQQTWSHNSDTLNVIYITSFISNDVPKVARAI